MKTIQQLLHLLADGQQHSGEALAKYLNMSRAGVWKAIQQLNKLGVEIQSTHGNGYKIQNGLDLLDKKTILAALEPHYQQLIDELVILDQVDSTNNYLLQHIHSNQCMVCLAEHQTHARGRRGRQWVAPLGHNIYCSFLWHFQKDPGELIGLSLAIAVATLRTLQSFGIHQQLSLKWPNDILHMGKKLVGILVDVVAESHHYCSVVIGVGINTHLSLHSELITQPWTSLQAITQQPVKRNLLASLLIKHVLIALAQFSDQGLKSFLEEWNQFDQLRGKEVMVITTHQEYYGKMQGISETGELILIDEQHNEQRFLSGEASLRLRD